MKNLLNLLSIVLTLSCFAFNLTAQVTVCTGENYTGDCVELNEGAYPIEDLRKYKIPNDRTKSIKVPDGWTVTVYEHSLSGKKQEFTASTKNIVGIGISSFEITAPQTNATVLVCTEVSYGGNCIELNEGVYPIEDLRKYKIPNDRTKSIKVPDGWTVTVYEHSLSGKKQEFTASTKNIVGIGISSFEITAPSTTVRSGEDWEKRSDATVTVSVCTEANYGGDCVELTAGAYPFSDLKKYGIPNDRTGSIKVPDGWTVTIYEHDFKGQEQKLIGDTPEIRMGVSSFKIVSPSVLVCTEANYGGNCVELSLGEYPFADLPKYEIPNDRTGSIKVPNGWTVTIYEHDFKGKEQNLTTDTPNINMGVSSFKISRR